MPALLAGLLSALAFSAAARSVRCVSRRRLRERAGCRPRGSRAPAPDGPAAAEAVPVPPTARWRWRALMLTAISCGLLVAGPPGAALVAATAAALPRILRIRRAARERASLDEQLTEAVASIAAGMRAGFSLAQALRFAADEGSPRCPDRSQPSSTVAPSACPSGPRSTSGQKLRVDATLAWSRESSGSIGVRAGTSLPSWIALPRRFASVARPPGMCGPSRLRRACRGRSSGFFHWCSSGSSG
jgi:hypothetical protein